MFNLAFQVSGERSLVFEAREYITAAQEAMHKAGETRELGRKLTEANVSVMTMEKWVKSCEDGENAVKLGEEALLAGDLNEAGRQCKLARKLLSRGLKCETLQFAVEELEKAVNAG
jgi:hypothetical protein